MSAVDSKGRTIWIVDAHRDDGKRFVVHADEILTVFMELESVVRARGQRFIEEIAEADVSQCPT